jgi:hypothetical protein
MAGKMTKKTNGHALSALSMMQDNDNSPPTPSHIIVETERGKDFDTGGYKLVRDGRVVARGSAQEIVFALSDQGVRGAGTVIGLRLNDGREASFKIRTRDERASGVSAIVHRSDRGKPQ